MFPNADLTARLSTATHTPHDNTDKDVSEHTSHCQYWATKNETLQRLYWRNHNAFWISSKFLSSIKHVKYVIWITEHWWNKGHLGCCGYTLKLPVSYLLLLKCRFALKLCRSCDTLFIGFFAHYKCLCWLLNNWMYPLLNRSINKENSSICSMQTTAFRYHAMMPSFHSSS